MRKITVALNLPKRDNEVIVYAKHIADCIDGNPWFPAPTVPMATLRAHIAEVEVAQVVALRGPHGSRTPRTPRRSSPAPG